MNKEFIDAIEQIAREKNLPFEQVLEFIESGLAAAYRRDYLSPTSPAIIEVTIDRKTGAPSVFTKKTVVKKVEEDSIQISLKEAQKMAGEVEEGDELRIEVTPPEFGRIAAQSAKQVIAQRIREAERDIVYNEFAGKINDIVTGIVHRYEGKGIFVDLGRTEGYLPPGEQVQRDHLKPGQRLKVYVMDVRKTSKGPQILLSRSHPNFLKRMFVLEVPEIASGLVELKATAREPGYRSKIAVWSRDPRVDAIGACVGSRGQRVQAVVDELHGEKIDIIAWSEDPTQYIAKALSPARVSKVTVNEAEHSAIVTVPEQQLSLAIGREGQNARLAVKLTGWRIDIKSDSIPSAIQEVKSAS